MFCDSFPFEILTMLNDLLPFLYGISLFLLLWQAVRVMKKGFDADPSSSSKENKSNQLQEDRTGQITIHPELITQDGVITDEDLLTVRFSKDIDPPKSTESPSE